MPKNSKVVKRDLDEDVTESVKDLLSNEDTNDDQFKKSDLYVDDSQIDKDVDIEDGSDAEEERPAWNSKLQYILAQVGFSVGLGNVWRFPYLCQKNGGGAYLIPYFILLIIIGIPLFFLELAVGQRIRRGSIGVWNYISPRLGGIGFSSCIVCFFVALYYNVIISWSLFYFSKSFQHPLPWDQCPLEKNGTRTFVVPECEKSSATTYFWYREALDISDSISESGGLNWKMTICLFIAWTMVCLAMIKGIQSSGKHRLNANLYRIMDKDNTLASDFHDSCYGENCLDPADETCTHCTVITHLYGTQPTGTLNQPVSPNTIHHSSKRISYQSHPGHSRVMYFSSLFPYVVLICFLVRSLLLKGSVDGIRHMFTPKLEIMLDPQVWREAATQVFFALGLGFGGVIAFSSYNKRDNNCHFDAVLVSLINFFTSVLATLVVFGVLGFKANIINEKCIVKNADKILEMLSAGVVSHDLIPHHVNFSEVSSADYYQMYDIIKGVKEEEFSKLGLESCKLSDELNQAVQGTGLAFIAFTEAMTHFPAAPFWSVLFFLMLVNLGLGSMFGTIEGIITPLVDTFKIRKEILTLGCCLMAFCVGLLFVQRSGNYFVTMFDDYSATLPLLIVVILENCSIAWVYGTDKFMEDLKDMLGFAPFKFYYYMWKYVSPIILIALLVASIVQMCMSPPGYHAWISNLGSEKFLSYPPWGLAVCISLMLLALLPVPIVFIVRHFNLIDDGSNSLASVSYKKGRILKENSNLEEDDASLLQSKAPSEMPSPVPGKSIYRKQSGSPTAELDTAPNGRYGIGYLMADMPESDL